MAQQGTPASDLFQPCVRDAGASGINVDGLPPLPDFDLIEQQTVTLRTAGTTISTSINAAAGNWRGLSSVYEAPEAPIVLSGFVPVLAHARQLETALSSAIGCLNDYAARSRELKGKVEALRGQVNGLDDLIGGNDDWQAHISIVDQRRDLFNEDSALAQEILTSDATCATALNAIHGGGAVTAPSIPVSDLNGSSDPISNFFTNALHAYGSDEEIPDQPWGPATVSVRLGGPWSFAQGFTSSVLGTLGATHTLFATTDKVKQAQAWQGMALLAGAGLTTSAVVSRGFTDASKSEIDAVLTVTGAVKSVIHYDEWGRDPAYASGAASFDVASFFIPGGVGVGAKAGALAGHVGVAGAWTGRLLEEAGGAGRWTGKLGEIPAKAHAALNGVSVRAWENTVRPALDNLAGALNRLDEGTATVRVADGVAAGGHGPFAGAADTVYSMVNRVDQSLQAGAKATPLDPLREAPAPAGTPNTPVRDAAADLGGLRELPGRAPEHQPALGDTDGGSGVWSEPGGGRSINGVPDQRFATGVTATGPKGYLLEYIVNYADPSGIIKDVDFDGHLWRGDPPTEVFQEVKGNHDFLYKGFMGDDAPQKQIQSWIGNQFRRQIQALEVRAPGARLEWVFTKNDELAEMLLEAVEDFLADRGSSISVDVKFVPMKG